MRGLLVACLCAEWCGTCRDYRPTFEALSTEFAQHRFVWIDVEDQAELAIHIDIENFPTLLIARGEQLLFAGTMLPHIGHLRRLLLTLDEQATPQLGKLSIAELDAFQELATTLDQEKR
jgi:thioredoxin-like negative regulator of GroEL